MEEVNMASNSHIVGFNSYVDIAISMSSPHLRHRELKDSYLEDETLSTSAEEYFKINTPSQLSMEWSKRVDSWQAQMPDKGTPIERCKSVKEIHFPALFLQHPIAAMSLWNVMEAFYELDRFVCDCDSMDLVSEWERMLPFEYLEAKSVDRKWRESLLDLKRDLQAEHTNGSLENSEVFSSTDASKKPETIRRGENWNAPLNASIQGSNKRNRESLRRRIDGIYSGIPKLEKAQGDLERNLAVNLEGISLVHEMLDTIRLAVQGRFSMIGLLNHGGSEDDATALKNGKNEERARSGIPGRIPVSNITRERWNFQKPIRRNSMTNSVRHVWLSTKRGEVGATSITIVVLLLIRMFLGMLIKADSLNLPSLSLE